MTRNIYLNSDDDSTESIKSVKSTKSIKTIKSNPIDLTQAKVSKSVKHLKTQEKPLVEEYLDYHDTYIKKFGKERTLVLMQVGSFYESYATTNRGPDLKALEELTDASIAHKGKDKTKIDINNPLMWGFPIVASTKFINILIENGYRLIMIDQITPKPNIRREVVAIHSPATYLDLSYKPMSNFVCVVCIEEILQKEGTLLACVGMSAIDVSTGEVFVHESLSQLKDDKLGLDEALRFIKSLVPKETLIFKENLQKISEDFIREYLDLKGQFHQFRDIDKDKTKLNYQKLILEKIYPDRENLTSIIDTLGLSLYSYARKALVNLLVYVSDHYEGLVKGLLEPKFYLSDSTLILGNDAINQLNIVSSKTDTNVKFHNLLDVVNKASTGMGKRYVKFRLVSPYTNPDTLNNIYEAVEKLQSKPDILEKLDKTLKKIQDIERLFRKIKLGVLHPTNMVDFIDSFTTVLELLVTLKPLKLTNDNITQLTKEIKKLTKHFDTIDLAKAKLYNINEIKANIFNHGIYPDLDKLQDNIGNNHDIIDELLQLLDSMIADKNAGQKIVLKHNSRDGYYFQLTSKRYNLLKVELDKVKDLQLTNTKIKASDFIVTKLNNTIKLSLSFLQNQTEDIDGLIEQIMNKTHEYYIDFMKQIEQFSKTIEKSIELVTEVDYYVCISKVAKEYNYVKPNIDDKSTNGYIEAEDLRHPIVERIIEHEYVPHTVNIGTDLKGMLIYGLNSAGKSVLMKAIGMSVVLAQAGFYVPAKNFTFYPYKALYTRITSNDNLFRGLSSYSLEIVELNSILKRATESTLIIGDEVCRGTEHISGNAVVASALLRLSDIGSTFVFATHLHELADLDEIAERTNIKAFHLSVEHDEANDTLIYDRELKSGSGERIYGITVAKYIIKDEEFIKKALEIKNKLIGTNLTVKKSRYNSNLIVDRCEVCGTKTGLETHHINFQKDCEDGFVKDKSHIKKNQINNLTVLCQKCHDNLHSNKISIKGIKMTSKGKKLVSK